MNPHALLAACRAAGMTVTRDGDQLKVTRPTNAKTDKLLAELKATKTAVLATIAPPCGHWIGTESRHCGTVDAVRRYLPGWRCPRHTPAAVNGRDDR